MGSMAVISQFHFLRPYWLLLLLPFAVLLIANWRQVSKSQRLQNLIPEHLANVLLVGEQGWSKQLPLKLLSFVCFLLIIIAAGPSYYQKPSPFGEDTAPLIIVLDVSDSMLANDVAPNRLELAKQKISDLVDLRAQGKTALIAYAGSAHLAMPLTQDKQVFKPLLEAISPKTMPRNGKSAEHSLALIEKTLANSVVPGSVLLLTDDINNVAFNAYQHYFSSTSHQLLVMAVGNAELDVEVPVNNKLLRQLANNVDGEFIELTTDNDDLDNVLSRINQHMRMNPDSVSPWQDASHNLVFLVAALYLFWFRKGWLVKWSVMFFVVSTSVMPNQAMASDWRFADLWLTGDQQGRYYFEQKDYSNAAQHFDDNLWKALSYYYAGDYQKAHQYFMYQNSLTSKFGAGCALAQTGDYHAAKTMFQDVVDQNPDFIGAQHNLNLINQIIFQLSKPGAGLASGEAKDFAEINESKLIDKVSKAQNNALNRNRYSAEQLLHDEKLNEKWMNRVDGKLENFVTIKFHLQLKQGQATQGYNKDE